MDIIEYNREAWNREVRAGNPWTVPVESHVIEAARRGDWQIVLTPVKPVEVVMLTLILSAGIENFETQSNLCSLGLFPAQIVMNGRSDDQGKHHRR